MHCFRMNESTSASHVLDHHGTGGLGHAFVSLVSAVQCCLEVVVMQQRSLCPCYFYTVLLR